MKQRKTRLLLAATAVSFSLLTVNPVYAAERPAERPEYEEELRSLFDSEWYASNYPDVVKVYGTDEDALFKHFMLFGINEGRGINTYFDVKSYKEANPDLAEAFGDDYAKYYQHYVTFGIDEARPVKDNYILTSALANSDCAVVNVSLDSTENTEVQNNVDEEAIQREYQRLLVDEGVYGAVAKMKQDTKKFEVSFDDFVNWFDNELDTSIISDFDTDTFENRINEYKNLKEISDNNHATYFAQKDSFKEKYTALLYSAAAIKNNNASELQIKEAYDIANSTLDLAEKNNSLASTLMNDDTKRLQKIQEVQNQLKVFKDSADRAVKLSTKQYLPDVDDYVYFDFKYDEFINSTGPLAGALDRDLEDYLSNKAQFWTDNSLREYYGKYNLDRQLDERMQRHVDDLFNRIYNCSWLYNNTLTERVNVKGRAALCNELGEVLESYVPDLKDKRLEYDNSITGIAYKRLSNYYSEELDFYEPYYSNKYKELEDIHKEVINRKTAECEAYINGIIPKEMQDYVKQEASISSNKYNEAKSEYNTASNNLAAVGYTKEEIEEIMASRNIEPNQPVPSEPSNPNQPDTPSEPSNPDQPDTPSEPSNPDQPDTPSEPSNPDQPDTPSEPSNPDQPDTPGEPSNPDQPDTPDEPSNPGQTENQPKPCYPSTIIVDVNGTFTINIVSEVEASIDFDGHFGIKFKP